MRVVALYQAWPKIQTQVVSVLSLFASQRVVGDQGKQDETSTVSTPCRLHRDTERLEVSSLYPLHPTLTHTGSMRARHSAWGRQSRHQDFNYGCQAAPAEQVLRVLRFPRILNHQ